MAVASYRVASVSRYQMVAQPLLAARAALLKVELVLLLATLLRLAALSASAQLPELWGAQEDVAIHRRASAVLTVCQHNCKNLNLSAVGVRSLNSSHGHQLTQHMARRSCCQLQWAIMSNCPWS